jgi:serine/threonine protein phosphatase PrpC
MEKVAKITALNVASATHEGMSGKHNEDSLGVFAWKLDDQRVLHIGVVADGVGGQIAGEVASSLTIAAVEKYFDKQDRVNNISGHLEQAIRAANEAVYHASQENPEYRGMSTTIAMAAIADGQLYTAHVGDSRLYFWRDGRLRQISTDHTWAQEAIEAGLLTREQAKTHPNRNVIKRHLGGNLQIEVDHRLVLEPGQSADEAHANQGLALKVDDLILICSDGLTDMISDESVYETLQRYPRDLDTAAKELIDKANEAGGRDNITVVLIKVPEAADLAAAATLSATTLMDVAPSETPTMVSASPSPKVATRPAPAAKKTGRGGGVGLPLILAGVAIVALLAVAAVAAFFIFRSAGDGAGTETPTSTAAVQETPAATRTVGAPATAAILATADSETEAPEAVGSGTPAPPTLRPTLTPTPSPTRPPATTTPAPAATNTIPPTFTPLPTQAAAPTSPPSTEPPPPTFTPEPTTAPQATDDTPPTDR